MKSALFLDTNVVLDIVLDRSEFVKEGKEILLLKNMDKVDLHLSALTLSTVAYFSKKFGKNPVSVISSILKWCDVVDLKKEHFESSILSKFKDFEDALQYFGAREIKGIDYIITRNISDFKYSAIPILTPADFLANFNP
jgi:predicted nucleic acid-binding protein